MNSKEKLIKDLEFKVKVYEEKERVFNIFNEVKELICNCKSYDFLNDLYVFLNKKWQVFDDQIRANYLYVIDRIINQSILEVDLIKINKM